MFKDIGNMDNKMRILNKNKILMDARSPVIVVLELRLMVVALNVKLIVEIQEVRLMVLAEKVKLIVVILEVRLLWLIWIKWC